MIATRLRTWIGKRWRSIAEPAALYYKLVWMPREVRALAFGRSKFRPQLFFLASVSIPSALMVWAIGGSPDAELSTPPYLEKGERFVAWLVPIGLPMGVAALIFLSSLTSFAIVRVAGVKVPFARLWRLALIDAGVSGFASSAFYFVALALVLIDATISALLVILACQSYLLWWRYIQFKWISRLGSAAALLLTIAATVASTFPYVVVNYRVAAQSVSEVDMLPTLMRGDTILIDRYEGYWRAPAPGELFYLCRENDVCAVRRLVAVAGQVAQFRSSLLYINGSPTAQMPAGTFGVCMVGGVRHEQLLIEVLPNQERHYITYYRLFGSAIAAPGDLLDDWTRPATASQSEPPAPSAASAGLAAMNTLASGGGFVLDPPARIADSPPIRVPQGAYLFASDLRASKIGEAPLILASDAQIVGRVFFRLWPLRQPLDAVSSDGIGRIDPAIAGVGQRCRPSRLSENDATDSGLGQAFAP